MSIDNQYPSIAGLPICDWYNNVHNCPIYWNIKGTIFTDNNMNCLIDSSEKLNGNIKLNLYENGNLIQQTFTNVLGEYSFDTDTGTYTYTIDTTGLPYKINCPAAGNYTTSVTSANPINDGKDFSIECKPSFDVGVKSIVRKSGIFFPGDSATLYVLAGDISNLYNLKCASGISGTVSVTIYGAASFIDAANGALIPTVSGNILTYAIADFGAVNLLSDFGVIVLTHTNAQINDQVCFVVAVTPLSGDNNTTNNNYTQCFTVGNSYDPNEKEVYPSGTIDSSQHSLTYSIHFQNTGNSAAQHIYILDTLDISIDESSIQLLAYSHEPIVQVIGNVLKFNFSKRVEQTF